MSAKMILRCPNCNANIPYNGNDRICVCEYCGTQVEPDIRPKEKSVYEMPKEEERIRQEASSTAATSSDSGSAVFYIISALIFMAVMTFLFFMPGASEDSIPEGTRPNRNGFDTEIKSNLTADYFTIYYPSYFEIKDDSGSHYSMAPTKEKDDYVTFTLDYYTNDTELDSLYSEEGVQFCKDTFYKNGKMKGVKYEMRKYGSLSGVWMEGRIEKGFFMEGGISQYNFICMIEGHPDEILFFSLTQADTSKYNYIEDYISILKSVVIQ